MVNDQFKRFCPASRSTQCTEVQAVCEGAAIYINGSACWLHRNSHHYCTHYVTNNQLRVHVLFCYVVIDPDMIVRRIRSDTEVTVFNQLYSLNVWILHNPEVANLFTGAGCGTCSLRSCIRRACGQSIPSALAAE